MVSGASPPVRIVTSDCTLRGNAVKHLGSRIRKNSERHFRSALLQPIFRVRRTSSPSIVPVPDGLEVRRTTQHDPSFKLSQSSSRIGQNSEKTAVISEVLRLLLLLCSTIKGFPDLKRGADPFRHRLSQRISPFFGSPLLNLRSHLIFFDGHKDCSTIVCCDSQPANFRLFSPQNLHVPRQRPASLLQMLLILT